ncbi:MAG: methyltransferase domain-containing protein [Candidatus Aureabacteria bacterium]|nr:methyltransferase domain-containing protein [Candidatus Auribacterota bacterium]
MVVNYNKIASEYARNRQLHPEVFKDLISTSKVTSNDRVLEVGCGTGNYIVAFDSVVSCSCWGVDPSTEMLSKAKERSNNIHFQLGQAEVLKFKSNYFTLVFSVDVIHHINKHLAYFQEAYRVLKKGGRVCTVTDSKWIIHNRRPLATYFPESIEIELKRYPRIVQLSKIMAQVGFRSITEKMVEFHYKLKAIQAYKDKSFSSLHFIPEEAFQRGINRMKKDLQHGPIPCVSRYLLLWGTK